MQIIQLSGTESITAVRNLLETAYGEKVLLVVPRNCQALSGSQVNLALVRRWAENLALPLALVVHDSQTRMIARAVGLLVFSSVSAAEKKAWPQPGSAGPSVRIPPRPSPPLAEAQGPQQAVRMASPRASVAPALRGLALPAVGLLLVGVILLFVLPSATVTLNPLTEPIAASMDMTGVAGLAQINYEQAQVRARIVSVELESSDTIIATDGRDVPNGYSSGTVILANKVSEPTTIPKGTVVRTSFGESIRFFTVADVEIPGQLYAAVRVGVLAAEPGPFSNVGPLTINVIEGELAARVNVLNDARTTGGSVRRMPAVHGEDKVKLRAKLMESLQQQAYAQLIASLSAKDFIPQESLVITVLAEEFDHKIGDLTDALGMTMRVRVSGLAIDSTDGEELLLRLLEQRLPDGYRLVPDSAVFQRTAVLNASAAEATFSMSARAFAGPALDINALRGAIAGQTAEDAQRTLASLIDLSSEPKVELGWSPLRRLPWWPLRIQVRVTAG